MLYVEKCEFCQWHLRVWRLDNPGDVKVVPFKCRSWRHSGECRLWKGAQDFVRCRQALESLPSWCHLTLTYADQKSKSIEMTYRTGTFLWQMLLKRLKRKFDEICYIQTWERHKSGFPHIHIAICNRFLHGNCAHQRSHDKDKLAGFANFRDHIQADAIACYFGQSGSLEPIRNPAAMAGYLGKLARELTGGAKEYQIPENAPPHFRRLRATRGLLPPTLRDPDITGTLVFAES